MDEETSDTMNLDLNLGPGPEAELELEAPNEAVNLDDWVDDPIERIREAVRIRAQQHRRWRQFQLPLQTQSHSVELNQLIGNPGHASTLQAGEGSVAAEERINEAPKLCENNNVFLEDEVPRCYLLRSLVLLAMPLPVVACSFRCERMPSLQGRGDHEKCDPQFMAVDVPPVSPRRIRIWRSLLGLMHGGLRDLSLPQDSNGSRGAADRTQSLLNRIMTYRGMRAEQNPIGPPDEIVALTQTSPGSPVGVHARRLHDIVDLMHSGTASTETGSARRANAVLLRRSHTHAQRSSSHNAFFPPLNSTEGLVETYFRTHSIGRNHEQPQSVDDRDSFSSIAAVINSENHMDTAVEIDSPVSLSTSSSRRRNNASRVSDVDSGDSRAPRRRRLN
ncbi:hypothetical protein OIU78_019821 [Salix suchowensis]|nr:hypothetical protein OIU78_019821 [Salix suchowensis]